MAINPYDKGSVVRISATFKDVNGNPVDPGTIVFTVRKPDGPLVTLTVVKDATGTYHADLSLDEAGSYSYRCASTPPGQGSSEGELFARDSDVF